MDSQATTMINGLFEKLQQAETQSGQREAEVEAHIRAAVEAQPSAPYYMAQTILVQEQALQSLSQRVQELEQAQASQPAGSGGFLGSLFGSGNRTAAARVPVTNNPSLNANGSAFRNAPQSSFLGGAMQTAMGVAGGVMLANAVTGMFAGEAEADPASEEQTNIESSDDWGSDAGFDEEF